MATIDFNVTKEDGWKALTSGAKRITRNSGGNAFIGEAEVIGDLTDVEGEKIFDIVGVPYNLDSSKNYFIRTTAFSVDFGVTV